MAAHCLLESSVWQELADKIELILGVPVTTAFESPNRYLIKGPPTLAGNPVVYLRVETWLVAKADVGEQNWAKLGYFVVAADYRRQGYGRQIISATKEWLYSLHQFDQVCLFARPEIMPFWQACGFYPVENETRMCWYPKKTPK